MLPSHGELVSDQSVSDSSWDMSSLVVCWLGDVEISLPDLIDREISSVEGEKICG